MEIYRWLRHQWDRASAVVLVAAGLVALLLGWLGVSREGLPAAQIPYLASGAVLGLFLLGAAATLWLSADLRDLWRKFDDIHHDLTTTLDEQGQPSAPEAPAGREHPADAEAGSNGRRPIVARARRSARPRS